MAALSITLSVRNRFVTYRAVVGRKNYLQVVLNTMIVIKGLRVDVLGETVFDRVNLVIRPRERIGIYGTRQNDVSTFLGVVVGDVEADEGTVTCEGERVAYVSSKTLAEGTESLARILHTRPTFLVIDGGSVVAQADAKEIERFIKGFRGGILIASEDPGFMQAANLTRMFEIDAATRTIGSYTKNYSDYLIEREKNQERIREAYEKQQKEKRRLEDWLTQKRDEANKDRSPEKGATIRAKAKYLKREILDKEIPNPNLPE